MDLQEMKNANIGGVFIPRELADNAFYGFRHNKSTGRLTLERIKGEAPIILPQQGVLDPKDYVQWAWSVNTLEFSFNPENGHLMVKVQ